MKIKLFLLLCICTFGLVGCACTRCTVGCSSCGYFDYPSQCGAYSCTDNSGFEQYNNPCPGPYRCVY